MGNIQAGAVDGLWFLFGTIWGFPEYMAMFMAVISQFH